MTSKEYEEQVFEQTSHTQPLIRRKEGSRKAFCVNFRNTNQFTTIYSTNSKHYHISKIPYFSSAQLTKRCMKKNCKKRME